MLPKQPFWPHSDCVLYNSSCGDMFLHSSVCVCVSGTVDDRLAPCVWPIAVCELQGQAVEGRAGDLSLRIELISLITRRPLLPLLSLYAVLLWRWRAFLSVFACIHYGWCGWSCLVNLLKFMSCVHTRGHVYTESIQIEICKKKSDKTKSLSCLWDWVAAANGAEYIMQIHCHFLYIFSLFL